jgi:hypothetical protein
MLPRNSLRTLPSGLPSRMASKIVHRVSGGRVLDVRIRLSDPNSIIGLDVAVEYLWAGLKPRGVNMIRYDMICCRSYCLLVG